MKIDVEGLNAEPRKIDIMIEPSKLDLDRPDVTLKGDVSLRAELRKPASGLEVEGVLAFAADVDCSRCATAVGQSFLFDFEADYVDPENFASESEKEISSDEMQTDVLVGGSIDLIEMAREQILLNLPEQSLCSDDCKGVCAKCGADLNVADCGCGEDPVDPRWSALKNLK